MLRLTTFTTLILTGLLSSAIYAQQVYKTVDEKGNVTYSDAPPSGEEARSEAIPVSPINTVPSTNANLPRSTKTPRPPEAAKPPLRAEITWPRNATLVRNASASVTVTVQLSGTVPADLKLQLLLDGQPYGDAQSSTAWDVNHMEPGLRSLQVAVLDKRGKTLTRSGLITVTVPR